MLEARLPADRRDTAGTARPPLRRGGADREGGRLLVHGGVAVSGAVGGERSDRPPDPGSAQLETLEESPERDVSMDPNPYEVTEPELLRGLRL